MGALDHILSKKKPHVIQAWDIHIAFHLFRQMHKQEFLCSRQVLHQLGKYEFRLEWNKVHPATLLTKLPTASTMLQAEEEL